MSDKKEKIEIEEKIDRYIDGELSQEEIDDLWVTLIQHEEYIDYLKTSANLKDMAEKKKTNQENNTVWMYAAAAAIVLLLVVFGSLQTSYFDNSSDIQPIETIELDYYRSAENLTAAAEREQIIREAIELFNEDKFEEAVSMLNEERNSARDVEWISRLDITLGTLYYNTDRFNNASFYFKDIVANYKNQVKVLTLEKAYWYLGNSYFQMDNLDEAEKAMRSAYELNGAYSRVAKSYLDAMDDAMAKLEQM
jgi:tetratricopeptide (TPR) repeat protein